MEFYWETLKNLNEQTKFPFNDTDLKKNLNINKNIPTDWLNLGFWDYWRKLSLFFALKLSRLLHTNNTLRELLFRFLGRNESSFSVEIANPSHTLREWSTCQEFLVFLSSLDRCWWAPGEDYNRPPTYHLGSIINTWKLGKEECQEYEESNSYSNVGLYNFLVWYLLLYIILLVMIQVARILSTKDVLEQEVAIIIDLHLTRAVTLNRFQTLLPFFLLPNRRRLISCRLPWLFFGLVCQGIKSNESLPPVPPPSC